MDVKGRQVCAVVSPPLPVFARNENADPLVYQGLLHWPETMPRALVSCRLFSIATPYRELFVVVCAWPIFRMLLFIALGILRDNLVLPRFSMLFHAQRANIVQHNAIDLLFLSAGTIGLFFLVKMLNLLLTWATVLHENVVLYFALIQTAPSQHATCDPKLNAGCVLIIISSGALMRWQACCFYYLTGPATRFRRFTEAQQQARCGKWYFACHADCQYWLQVSPSVEKCSWSSRRFLNESV